ncbi:MAG: leucine--tRNA ligase [Chloroflexi bacterium]|nr:leucine--tRNA ligase [Chloroflexota bacterium]
MTTTTPRTEIEPYDPGSVAQRWQQRWEADGLYRTPDHVEGQQNWYALTMLPYTSGDLHVGHWFAMAPSDVLARFKRMQGYNVLFPMGFDAFGLPAENAAIAGGVHPKDWTDANIERMRGQLKRMGAMFDWEREINSSDPSYYRWTQWWFLQLYRQGLAYRAEAAVNWCPSCNTVLANEQVIDGHCERCHTEVEQRQMEQWFFRITDYAEQLLDNDQLEWPEHVKRMQRNWIGRSEGTEVSFALETPTADGSDEIRVFTTRPDTLCGVTFMVLAPEHPLVSQITTEERRVEVEAYVEQARHTTEIERQATDRPKTGVFTGAYSVNRLTGERVPIWIADYALATYGTGAVMGVPAHDQRDFELAGKFGLEIRVVVAPPGWDGKPLSEAYLGRDGSQVSSGRFDGMPNAEGYEAIADHIVAQGWGERRVTYRMRDWLISRQRYWGTPIPILYCDDCGTQPVPEDQLPVVLPEDAEFKPTGDSPLKRHAGFLNTTCPQCGGPATRETDTMDTFVDSSWYFLRYVSPHDDEAPFDAEKAKLWGPVDQYTGGAEHAVMHLLYARFFVKMMRDLGLVDHGEPFLRLFNQGIVLSEHTKMSKSRGNVVAPDAYVSELGADVVRLYLMFMGPWEGGGDWSDAGINGIARWMNRAWDLATSPADALPAADGPADRDMTRRMHQTIRRVTTDIERFKYNTALAAMMELTNDMAPAFEARSVSQPVWAETVRRLLLLLAPMAPHVTEELWERTGNPYSIHAQPLPAWDDALAAVDEATLVVQVNGKVRERIAVPADISEADAKQQALASERVRAYTDGHDVTKVVFVPGRHLVSVVVK